MGEARERWEGRGERERGKRANKRMHHIPYSCIHRRNPPRPFIFRPSLSAILGHGRDHVKLSQDRETAGPTITQLKDTLQVASPFLEILAMHIPANEEI